MAMVESVDVEGDVDQLIAQGTAVSEAGGRPRKRKRKLNPYVEWLLVLVVAIGSAQLVNRFVVQQFAVDGASMDVTLHHGDRVLVNKLSYRLHEPRRGDVVVLKQMSGKTERDLIKRVIALPGEVIEVKDCVVTIDGKVLYEPYLDPEVVTPSNCGPGYPATKVPEGAVFVMGDNRPGSGDSRSFGAVDEDLLIGRAFVVIWPFGDWQWL
jgi:signal peptidase I